MRFLVLQFAWISILVHNVGGQRPPPRDPNAMCKDTEYGGIYHPYYARCCKEKRLTFEIPHFTKCQAEVSEVNPDDDLSTNMWKIRACQIKKSLGLSEDKLDFKAFVDFLTVNYTTDNDVQGVVRNSNKDCPGAATKSDFHTKIQAFHFCFYENERKVCENPSTKASDAKAQFLATLNSKYLDYNATCTPLPGVWNEREFCCKDRPTPRAWDLTTFLGYSHWAEGETVEGCSDCRYNIRSLYPPERKQDETSWDRYDFSLLDCFDACVRQPVIFPNGSNTAPNLHFDFNATLDTIMEKSNHPAKLKEELKAVVLKHKATFKMAFNEQDYEQDGGITMNDIETQYSKLTDQKLQIKYYCTYYRNIWLLAKSAIREVCMNENAVRIHLYEVANHPNMPHEF